MKPAITIAVAAALGASALLPTGCASSSGRPQMWIDHIDPRAEQQARVVWVAYADDGETTRGLALVDARFRSWMAAPTLVAGPDGASLNIDTDNPTGIFGKFIAAAKGLGLYMLGRKEMIVAP